MREAADTVLLYAAVVAVALALSVIFGCAASITWTIGAGAAAAPGTTAASEHLDADAIRAVGEAGGAAARAAVGLR